MAGKNVQSFDDSNFDAEVLKASTKVMVDFTADLRPTKGTFKGLWLRFRYARRDRGGSGDDRRDFRVIFNYEISL